VKPESNRQKSAKPQTAEEFRAALARLAAAFPEGTVVGNGTLKDVQEWQRGDGPGRRYAIDPADFRRKRGEAVADLLRELKKKPTRQQIADRLLINVRTLYAYDHNPKSAGTSKVGITIAWPGFRIESGH
jgi:hypothetical protein